MIVLFLLNFVVPNPGLPTFRVKAIVTRVSEHDGEFMRRPLMVQRVQDRLFILDLDSFLWCIGVNGEVRFVTGGLGQAPGQFGAGPHAISCGSDRLYILESSGYRTSTFDMNGHFIEWEKHQESLFLKAEGFTLKIATNDPLREASVVLEGSGSSETYPLVEAEDDDIAPVFSFFVQQDSRYALLYSTSSRQKTIYYALFDLQKAGLVDLQRIKIIDPRDLSKVLPDNATIPIVQGCSISKKYGFVLTAYPNRAEQRYLHLLDPDTRKMTVIKIICEGMDLTFFQHLDGPHWAAFDEDELVFFELEPVHP